MTANMKVINTQSDPNSSDFPMGKTSSVTPPDSLKECLLSFVSHVHGCPPTIHFVFVVRERLSTSNQNGGYLDMSLKVKFVWLLFFAASSCRRFRRFLDHLCKGRNVYTQTSNKNKQSCMLWNYLVQKKTLPILELVLRKRKYSVHVLCVCIAWCEYEGALGEFKTAM